MKKEIIILTKSDKRAGYCIAGIDKETGEWVRVISSNWMTEHAVPGSDLVCDDGKEVDIYDVVEIEFIKAVPTNVQPENYLYNEKAKWKKKGKSNLDEVLWIHCYDNADYVFGNTQNRLEGNEAYLTESSILMLKVDNSRYNVKRFPERTLFQMNFSYKKEEYSFFKITQKDLKEKYSAKADGWYPTGTDTFVFSLTDKYKDGRYYKVVAQALM